jgi:diketogulonate reductase-like aldo/keto reductase
MQQLPDFIYGTAWKEEDTRALTEQAIDAGFRAIDTANQPRHYNEEGVGEAISAAMSEDLVGRDELFLQTKFTYPEGQGDKLPYNPDLPTDEQVRASFQSSLDHLGVNEIETYLLHGPKTRDGLVEADRIAWQQMEELRSEGRVQHLGVSNVTPKQLNEFVDLADQPIRFCQNRCFARATWDRHVRDICKENDITYQGFSLLTANGTALNAPDVREIAERRDKTVPQMIFRFAMDVGMIPLTGTTSREHLKQDLQCLDFELTDSEVDTIEKICL